MHEGSKGWGCNQIRQVGRDCRCRGRALRWLGFVCLPSQGMCECSKGAGCVIRVGIWGGPLGTERGLWGGWGLCVFLHRAYVSAARGRVVRSD